MTIPVVGGGGMRLPQKEVFFISSKIALQYCMRPLDGQGGMVKIKTDSSEHHHKNVLAATLAAGCCYSTTLNDRQIYTTPY